MQCVWKKIRLSLHTKKLYILSKLNKKKWVIVYILQQMFVKIYPPL